MSTIAHALVMTTEQNGWPPEVAIMAMGWVKFAGGDYTQPVSPEQMPAFREMLGEVAYDFKQVSQECGRYDDEEKATIPLAVKQDNVEALVIEMTSALKLHPAVAMQILGVITYAGGDLKKHIHIGTLSAHMGKAGARHGYVVDLQKAEDVPLNITGAVA